MRALSTTQTARARAALRDKYGRWHYRITGGPCNEQVHAYGQMPNSAHVGWYLLCDLRDLDLVLFGAPHDSRSAST